MSSTVRQRQAPADEREGCPECEGDVVSDSAESVCSDCGLVVDEERPETARWNPESDGEPTAGRQSGPFMHSRRGEARGSYIGHESIPHDGADRMFALRREHRRAWRDANGRTRPHAHNEIERMAVASDIPRAAIETACQLFNEAQDADLLIGRCMEGLATAALVAAARIHGHALPFDRAETLSRAVPWQIRIGYKVLTRDLGVPVPPPEAHRLVGPLCHALGVKERRRTDAERLAREHADALSGRKPAGIAAAAVWIATPEWVTQADICEHAHCCIVTLSTSADGIREAMGA